MKIFSDSFLDNIAEEARENRNKYFDDDMDYRLGYNDGIVTVIELLQKAIYNED